MNYSPKLKKVVKEIEEILKREDVAGLVVVHTPGFSEYMIKLDPGYSCCKIEGNRIKIRAKEEELGKAKRDQMLSDTANMLYLITQTAGTVIYPFFDISESLDKKLQAEHIDQSKPDDLPF